MHGIIVQVAVDASREDVVRKMPLEMVVPQAKSRPGLIAGYWLRSTDGDLLRAVQIYESADAAQSAAQHIRSMGAPPGAPVTLESVDVYEAVGRA